MKSSGPDPIDVAVGGRVKLQRRLRKVSQTQLAEHLGVTFQQVQKYERGTNRISASRLMMISDYFGVTPAFFFEAIPGQDARGLEPERDSETDMVTQFISSPEGMALNRAFVKIKSARTRQQIVALAKAVAEPEVREFAMETAGDAVGTLHSL
ncbi:transcriptional regulator with XRE-family HTH domain [Hoeflea marina]|uniref:Transcriptional regulator with XRE-family HTH domain n=1 Tax=Hoeflea marina TaxID=274592 RepID=A0A317PVW7_9HYPH|nr:helix-turn-helix transcriptional regulator [Hoeflea marina]PWW03560.1 transcriptional regulator with XRE-family HTH domain [Hoeflea marina]